LELEPTLEQEIRKGQLEDEKLKEITVNWKSTGFQVGWKWYGLVWEKNMCA